MQRSHVTVGSALNDPSFMGAWDVVEHRILRRDLTSGLLFIGKRGVKGAAADARADFATKSEGNRRLVRI
jgi:hypothetical protein